MKSIRIFSIALAGVFLMWGCQKEFSLEGSGTNGRAAGSLKDLSGNCLPIIVMGNYIQDSTLTDSNYVLVQANITAAGAYIIYTDLVNGMSFSDSGFSTSTGLQTFKLKGKGKPVLSGPNDFTLTFLDSTCSFNIITSTNASSAIYSLGSTAGSCTAANVKGTYQVNAALSTANKVDISVTVTAPGAYSISTTPAGGITFSATGTFTTTGPQTVTLQGTGTPTTVGSNTIALSAGGSTCSFTVTVATAAPPAVYTIGTTAGNCTGAVVQGTYTSGTALSATNRVNLTVNVTTIGSYTINTTQVGGMTFGATGTFTTTGSQTVTLSGVGTPTTTGSNTLPVSGGGNNCSFAVNVTAPTPGSGGINQSDSAWSFNQGTSFFRGSFDTAYTIPLGPIGLILNLEGTSTNVVNTYFDLRVIFTGSSIQTGVYTTSTAGSLSYYNLSADIYTADPTSIPGVVTSITITSYNATTRVVQGTFLGTVENATGAVVPIINGKFRAVVN